MKTACEAWKTELIPDPTCIDCPQFGWGTYLVSLSSCSSSCAILASKAAMEALYLDLTALSISCSLALSSLFWRSSCCRAFSFF